MYKSARFLRAEMISRRPANIERALQMDRDDGVEIVFRHTVEYLVAQDARIIDDKVNLAKLVDRLLYDAMRALPIGDTVAVRDRLATGVADLVHNLEGRPRIRPTDHAVYLRDLMVRDLVAFKIPKLLWFQDRASMAWGVETRVPFLDHHLVERLFGLPSSSLVRDGQMKYLCRRILKRFAGVEVSDRPKHYVATPQREWLKGPLYPDVLSYLDQGVLSQSGLIDYDSWRKTYREYSQSMELGNSFFVWKMVNLEALMRTFFQ